LYQRQEQALTADSARCPLTAGQGGTGLYDGVLPAQWPRNSTQTPDLYAAGREGEARSNACAASHAIPGAVLCCCTLGPAVRITLLTSGAKGTRTPDSLLANNRHHVHSRPYPQVTVLPRPSKAIRVRTCCGTSALYTAAGHVSIPPVASRQASSQHADEALRACGAGQALVGGQQVTAQLFGECHIGGVVGRDIRAQLEGPAHEPQRGIPL
jgi:hypothetical protein